MKTTFPVITGFIVALALPTGCSLETEDVHTVHQKRVHQTYSVDFREESNLTEFVARFRFGGTSGTNLRLGGKSSVLVNGKPMELHDFLGANYRTSQKGISATTTFDFVDADGRTYKNAGTLLAVALDPASVPVKHSKKAPLSIRWTGAPLRKAEWVEAQVLSLKKATIFVTAVGDTVTIPATEMDQFSVGAAAVKLRRQNSVELRDGNEVGGIFRTTYETKTTAFGLTE